MVLDLLTDGLYEEEDRPVLLLQLLQVVFPAPLGVRVQGGGGLPLSCAGGGCAFCGQSTKTSLPPTVQLMVFSPFLALMNMGFIVYPLKTLQLLDGFPLISIVVIQGVPDHLF